jgi:hypothetical protein
MRWTWLALCWGVALGAGGCESTVGLPPGSDRIALPAGPQWLQLIGYAASSDPSFSSICTPARVPSTGTAVTTIVLLTHDGEEWVARAPAPDTIELRFHDAGTIAMGGETVLGTAHGSAMDVAYPFHPALDVRATLSGEQPNDAAFVDGIVAASSSFVYGRVSGAIRFSDSSGQASTCTAIQWSLQPRRP